MLQGQTDLNTLGADIRALRKARGLTLAELAQTLCVDLVFVWVWSRACR